jgi:hypothetical protein
VINTENNSDIRSKLPSPLLYSIFWKRANKWWKTMDKRSWRFSWKI